MHDRILFLIDGENLMIRFQESVDGGATPRKEVVYEKDSFLWHPGLTRLFLIEPIRVSYYTTCVGDDVKIANLCKKIAAVHYEYCTGPTAGTGSLVPHVFKKEEKRKKTKSVDISITIDALRHTYNNSIDKIFLFSGDGDYLPLIEEVMRQGKQVSLGAFSSGLNSYLADSCDDFYGLDEVFFEKPPTNSST